MQTRTVLTPRNDAPPILKYGCPREIAFFWVGGVLKQHPPLYNFTTLYVGTENPMVKFNRTFLAVIWPIENTHFKMQEKLRSYMILNYHGISNVDADTPNLCVFLEMKISFQNCLWHCPHILQWKKFLPRFPHSLSNEMAPGHSSGPVGGLHGQQIEDVEVHRRSPPDPVLQNLRTRQRQRVFFKPTTSSPEIRI